MSAASLLGSRTTEIFHLVCVSVYSRLGLLPGGEGGLIKMIMKSVWFCESSRNQSCHSWPPARAACLLNWHWIQKRTAFVKAGANDGPASLERTDSRTETLSWYVPSHFSWWTQPDRVQKTLWGGAVWYQLPSCSAWQRVGWDPVDKGLSYIS